METDITEASSTALLTQAVQNISGTEGAYAIVRGSRPVNDFGRPQGQSRYNRNVRHILDNSRPNLFERAWPCLFPRGVGGIEADQQVDVSFHEHVRYALEYHDRRFRKDETFAYVSFSILQKRQGLLSAKLQMKTHGFERDAHVVSGITLEQLQQAKLQQDRGEPISDNRVRILLNNLYATAGRVMGTDQGRFRLRSQIWSTTVSKGPPSIWMTINPCDLHDPVAQVLTGEDIDLDDFVKTDGPDKIQ